MKEVLLDIRQVSFQADGHLILDRLDLTIQPAEIHALLEQRRAQFTFADDEERARFFGWFERWFVRRAEPPAEVAE